MKRNIGTLDAYLRLMFGLVGLTWSVVRLARRPQRRGARLLLWMSAMKVAEGVTRFCPMLFALGMDSRNLSFRMERKQNQPLIRFTWSQDSDEQQIQKASEPSRKTGHAESAHPSAHSGRQHEQTPAYQRPSHTHSPYPTNP